MMSVSGFERSSVYASPVYFYNAITMTWSSATCDSEIVRVQKIHALYSHAAPGWCHTR
jgi:hypothetical protein